MRCQISGASTAIVLAPAPDATSLGVSAELSYMKTKNQRTRSADRRASVPSSWPTPSARSASESSARGGRLAGSKTSMRKESMKRRRDELRPEYDLARLKGGVRGKYYQRAAAGTNLVLLEPDVARAFPDSDAVNRRFACCRRQSTPAAKRPVNRPPVPHAAGGRPQGASANVGPCGALSKPGRTSTP